MLIHGPSTASMKSLPRESTDIAIYLRATSGVCTVCVQALLVPYLIPRVCTDEDSLQAGLMLSSVQLLAYGLAPSLPWFIAAMLLFSPVTIYSPSLKSLLSRHAPNDQQGTLQGALGSIRTVLAGVGALLFSGLFSFSLKIDHHVMTINHS